MTERPEIPHRRHRLTLDLEADTLDELWHEMHAIADRLDREQREHAEITSGGYASGYHLRLQTDPAVTGDLYHASLAEWSKKDRAARRGEEATP
ncbi:hypothetical protein [Actinopolymorpha alba]|uniref:hypothetical protein n=1 Tax=Actinopolymorpha alba TaxID=533267 RepID=UPI0003734032|nr:hypothetical protein [Actinopolymorpha alba]